MTEPAAKKPRKRKPKGPFSDELIDQLLAQVKGKDAESLLGESGLVGQLKKQLAERMLAAELTHHLNAEAADAASAPNHRNGTSPKKVSTPSGVLALEIPRDRLSTFDPVLVAKHQRRLPGFNNHVIGMYARAMTVREIQGHLVELYGLEVSPDLISTITDEVMTEVARWQSRPLESMYPIVYFDALRLKIRDDGTVKNKAVYLALGIDAGGNKDVLGMWIEQTEGAKFWLSVLTDLKNRGLTDIFFVCCDGLAGLPDAITTAFPLAIVQTCIVHMIRATLRYVSYVDRKPLVKDLRPIYSAPTEAAALAALDAFEERWASKYPGAAKGWRTRWSEVIPFLAFPGPIRKILYTTNAVESLNAEFRKVLNPRVQFPHDDAALKVLFLALQRKKARTMAPKEWGAALSHFQLLFPERFPAG